MRVNTKKTKKSKKLLITIIVAILLAGGYFSAAYATKNLWPFDQPSSSDSNTSHTDVAPDSNDTNTPVGDDPTPPPIDATPENPTKTPPKYEGDNPDNSSSLTASFNYKNIANGTLALRITIEQQITSGSCTLVLSKDGQTVTKQAEIIANPSSATGKGFDIPVAELSTGTWNITLTVNGGGKTGTVSDKISV
jgi:hypothetical protein